MHPCHRQQHNLHTAPPTTTTLHDGHKKKLFMIGSKMSFGSVTFYQRLRDTLYFLLVPTCVSILWKFNLAPLIGLKIKCKKNKSTTLLQIYTIVPETQTAAAAQQLLNEAEQPCGCCCGDYSCCGFESKEEIVCCCCKDTKSTHMMWFTLQSETQCWWIFIIYISVE